MKFGWSRGLDFVTFICDDEAGRAVDTLNEQELDGMRIEVDHAKA